MEPYETIEYRDHLIEIHFDNEPSDPRDWSNVSTMICFHRDYNLGDKHDYRTEDYGSWAEVESKLREDFDIVGPILPLYLYDHSGITMRAGHGFSEIDAAGWDWGIVGFAFATRAGVTECMGKVEDYTDADFEKAVRQEVETYDMRLTGQVFGHIIRGPEQERIVTDADGKVLRTFTERDEVDACWDYYGDTDSLIAECKAIVDAEVK